MSQFIENYLGLSPALQENIFFTGLLFFISWLLQRIIVRLVISRIEEITHRYQWQKIVQYTTVIIGLIILIRIWFGAFEYLGTYLGLLSAGLAIAFKDLLVNFAGWMFILIRKPFKVGDRIEVGSVRGDVIDVRIFQFSVIEIGNWVDSDQSTGRIIHLPNSYVFTQHQANYTAGFEYIWNEIPVLITFESDWKVAKEILFGVLKSNTINLTKEAEKQIKEAAKKYLIFYKTLTPTVYTSVKDSGVLLTMRYICNARQRRGTEEILWEKILEEFSQRSEIDFAYPTQRFFQNQVEGKKGKTEI